MPQHDSTTTMLVRCGLYFVGERTYSELQRRVIPRVPRLKNIRFARLRSYRTRDLAVLASVILIVPGNVFGGCGQGAKVTITNTPILKMERPTTTAGIAGFWSIHVSGQNCDVTQLWISDKITPPDKCKIGDTVSATGEADEHQGITFIAPQSVACVAAPETELVGCKTLLNNYITDMNKEDEDAPLTYRKQPRLERGRLRREYVEAVCNDGERLLQDVQSRIFKLDRIERLCGWHHPICDNACWKDRLTDAAWMRDACRADRDQLEKEAKLPPVSEKAYRCTIEGAKLGSRALDEFPKGDVTCKDEGLLRDLVKRYGAELDKFNANCALPGDEFGTEQVKSSLEFLFDSLEWGKGYLQMMKGKC